MCKVLGVKDILCVYVCARARACVRVCMCMCVHAGIHDCMDACMCAIAECSGAMATALYTIETEFKPL